MIKINGSNHYILCIIIIINYNKLILITEATTMEKKGRTVKEKARQAERERAKHAAES